MIFLDTGPILAYANTNDEQHTRATEIFKEIDDGIYGNAAITDYVFDEAITLTISRTKNFKLAIKTGEYLLKSIDFLKVDQSMFNDAWGIFKAQHSHALSFTDCSIIAACKANGISTIATFDSTLKYESRLIIID